MSQIPVLSQAARGFMPLPLVTRPPRREPIVPVLGRPPRVHLWHIGCQMNDADREQLAEQFAEIGFVPEVPLARCSFHCCPKPIRSNWRGWSTQTMR